MRQKPSAKIKKLIGGYTMEYKIISDSSSDIVKLSGVPFANVPLKIITSEKEYVDTADLDVSGMLSDLEQYKGRSSSSCPNPEEWKEAFEQAQNVFCVTITSGLSGSCNCARISSEEYTAEHPDRNAFVVDSLSTGPENALLIEKLRDLMLEKLPFEEIKNKILEYKSRTHLVFALESMHNLANNGRVSPLVAKIAGVLGIRVVGVASNEGTLEVKEKVRGVQKTVTTIIENMKKGGFAGGKVRIHHCENPSTMKAVKEAILKAFPTAKIETALTRGLCSYYAERGGILVGYEGALKA